MVWRMAGDDAQRARDRLLVILAVTTGATDAAAFERLGHVFASVITGNLIVLGVSSVSRDGRLALLAGCVLTAYALGVFLAAPRREVAPGAWPSAATVALLGDLVLLVAFAVLWEIAAGHPGRGMQIPLLATAAGAMGVQSTAIRRLDNLTTTYLTSTLTGLIEAIAVRRWDAGDTRSLGIIIAALLGAAAATGVLLYADLWLPVLQLLPLAAVLVGSRRLIGRPVAAPAAAAADSP